MFRRMKDELTKYKERNESLEAQLASKTGAGESGHSRGMSAELRPELDGLRSQLVDLRKQSEQSSAQNEDLQKHIKKLKTDYDQQLSEQQSSTTEKLHELENEVDQLQDALHKAQSELDETLQINKQLNTELQSAMRNPGSSSDPNEPWSDAKKRLEQDLSSALNRSEWLKRENASLEERCKDAESKVTML